MSVLFVFLDEGAANLYQVKQWLQPLQRLARKHPVGVLHTNALVSELLRDSGLSDHRVEFPDGLGGLSAADVRKINVHQDQIKCHVVRLCQCNGATGGLSDIMAVK